MTRQDDMPPLAHIIIKNIWEDVNTLLHKIIGFNEYLAWLSSSKAAKSERYPEESFDTYKNNKCLGRNESPLDIWAVSV